MSNSLADEFCEFTACLIFEPREQTPKSALHSHRAVIALWAGRRYLPHRRTHHRSKRSLHNHCWLFGSAEQLVRSCGRVSLSVNWRVGLFRCVLLGYFDVVWLPNGWFAIVAVSYGDVFCEHLANLSSGICYPCVLPVLFALGGDHVWIDGISYRFVANWETHQNLDKLGRGPFVLMHEPV